MVVAIVDNRRALYRLPLFFQTRDVELLLGSAVAPEALDDKAMARALDKLADTGPKRVYASLRLRAIEPDHLGRSFLRRPRGRGEFASRANRLDTASLACPGRKTGALWRRLMSLGGRTGPASRRTVGRLWGPWHNW